MSSQVNEFSHAGIISWEGLLVNAKGRHMPVNRATLNLIRQAEGMVDHWYPDPAHGWAVPTCCIGHTDAAGEPKYAATKGKRFTEAEALAILSKDLASVEAEVAAAVKVPVNENQRGAVVSFTFNLGGTNLRKSTLLKKLNAGDYAGAAAQFPAWNKAAGKVLPGLVKRRAAEQALFLSAVDAKPSPGSPTPAPAHPQAAPAKSPVAAVLAVLAAIGAAVYAFLKLKGIAP